MARLSEEAERANKKLEERSRKAMGSMIAELREWDVFGTMTYDPKRRPQERMWGDTFVPRVVSADLAKKDFERWINDASGALGRPIEYVCGLEYQKNGFPHFHTLLDLSGLEDGDFKRIGGLWYKRCGYNMLEIPRSIDDCAAYAAKYLVKDISRGDVLFSRKLAERVHPVQLPFNERG